MLLLSRVWHSIWPPLVYSNEDLYFRWWWAFIKKHSIISLYYENEPLPSKPESNDNTRKPAPKPVTPTPDKKKLTASQDPTNENTALNLSTNQKSKDDLAATKEQHMQLLSSSTKLSQATINSMLSSSTQLAHLSQLSSSNQLSHLSQLSSSSQLSHLSQLSSAVESQLTSLRAEGQLSQIPAVNLSLLAPLLALNNTFVTPKCWQILFQNILILILIL